MALRCRRYTKKPDIVPASFLWLIVLFACSNTAPKEPLQGLGKGLKDYYSKYFPIGVSLSPASLKTDEAAMIVHEFNSITPENAMKMGPIHPKENEYYWKDADSIVAFAERHHLKVRGHALVWHQATPEWLFTDANGNTVSKDVLLQRLHDHIAAVVGRYKGRIYAWDVVNEAISDDANEFYRQSKLYQVCGEEFIAKAFEWAHAADPEAILFYNDYNEINPVKRAKIIALVARLRKNGVPVHAVGLQSHWSIYEPSRDQLEQTMLDFSRLQLPLQITELDISFYRKDETTNSKGHTSGISNTAKLQAQQVKEYKMCFEVFRKYRKHLTGVTFWNISDRHSWLDNFPIRNRKDYPLLFDSNLHPKKAYGSVVNF